MKIASFISLYLLTTAAWATKPSWINDPASDCPKFHLCAVGVAESRMRAEAEGRVSLSKIFQVKIESEFNESLTAHGVEISRAISESITEKTDELLEASELVKVYEGDTDYYALVSLDKMKARNSLSSKIDHIDQEVKAHLTESKTGSIGKIQKLLATRKGLTLRYEFLGGMKKDAPISLSDLAKLKAKLVRGKIVGVSAVYETSSENVKIARIAEKIFMDAGYDVNQDDATHDVSIKLDSKKEYLKVKGFVKYSFTVDLEVSKGNKKTDGFNHVIVLTGRSYDQTWEQAQPSIREFLKEKLPTLNLK